MRRTRRTNLETRRRRCYNKFRYYTPQAAGAALTKAVARGKLRNPELLTVYPCPYVRQRPHWHWGHEKKRGSL